MAKNKVRVQQSKILILESNMRMQVFEPAKEIIQSDDGKKLQSEINERQKRQKVELQKEINKLSEIVSMISKKDYEEIMMERIVLQDKFRERYESLKKELEKSIQNSEQEKIQLKNQIQLKSQEKTDLEKVILV